MCPHPTPPSDDECCPKCQGCSRAGQLFAEGQTKPDILDPCNECTCKKGFLECVKKACPVLPCAKHFIRHVKGQCCPVCVKQTEYRATPTTCLFRGVQYQAGEKFSVDPCTMCQCSANSTIECQRTTCQDLKCPLRRQRLVPGQCCPSCRAAALPATWADTCLYEDKKYKRGQSWTSGCDTCTCGHNGRAFCQPTDCPIKSCPGGGALVQKEGQCCPQCDNTSGICTVFGDPHYKTFDGRVFKFQGSCKYLLSQGPGFSVRITNDARDSLDFSWSRTVTIRLQNGPKVSLLQKMRVKIDGKKVSLPYIKLGVLSVMKDGYRVILRTNEGKKRYTLSDDPYLYRPKSPVLKFVGHLVFASMLSSFSKNAG